MLAARMRRCLLVCAATCSIAAITLPVHCADLQREKEARALLAEGEKLNEATRLYEALSTLQRVRQQYPDTEAGAFAEFWRAEVLARLGNTSEAIEIDQRIVKENPGAILACWAQYGMSQMMGPTPAGIAAMRRVRDMLPNRSDLTPFDLSRVVLGDWCGKYLVGHQDALDAADFLGLNRNDTRGKAETLAIVAAHVARTGGIEKAKPILDRLISECAGEREEVEWAKIEAAIACIDGKPGRVEFETLSAGWLTPYSIMTLTDDDQAAKACLALARCYKRSDKLSDAVDALRHASQRHANTGHGAQVLYEYGCALGRQGHNEEAIAALRQVIARKPLSTYATAAETMIDKLQSTPGLETASLEALIKEADANFDPKWQSLGAAPTDGSLDDPVMVARQVVALARQDMPEQALRLLRRTAGAHSPRNGDLLAANAAVCCRAARTALATRSYSVDTCMALATAVTECTQANSPEAAASLLCSVRALCDEQLSGSGQSATRADWMRSIGQLYRAMKRPRDAVGVFRSVVTDSVVPRETRAEFLYHLAGAYEEMAYRQSAQKCRSTLVRVYGDTPWTKMAAHQSAAQSVADGYRAKLVAESRGEQR